MHCSAFHEPVLLHALADSAVSSSGGRPTGVYCGGGATKATDRNVFTVANMPVGYASTSNRAMLESCASLQESADAALPTDRYGIGPRLGMNVWSTGTLTPRPTR